MSSSESEGEIRAGRATRPDPPIERGPRLASYGPDAIHFSRTEQGQQQAREDELIGRSRPAGVNIRAVVDVARTRAQVQREGWASAVNDMRADVSNANANARATAPPPAAGIALFLFAISS